MAGKSVGQWVGSAVGAVVGFFAGGNVALGATIGGMVGGLIDPPKGPSIVGPRLDDLTIQTSTYGVPVSRGYGTCAYTGNLFWLEGDTLREHSQTEESGGKGGGGQEYTTFSYTATFAVGLMQVTDPTQTVALRRLWLGEHLIYDAGSGNLESILASNSQTSGFTFYNGSDAQLPNARMQADKGIANVSGYPGLVYIVLEDLDLTGRFSNTLLRAQVKAELSVTSASMATQPIGDLSVRLGPPGGQVLQCAIIGGSEVVYGVARYSVYSGAIYRFDVLYSEYGVAGATSSTTDIASTGYGQKCAFVCQTDTICGPVIEANQDLFATHTRLSLMSSTGYVSSEWIPIADLPLDVYSAAVDRDQIFIVKGTGSSIYKFEGMTLAAKTAGTYACYHIGVSENYVFALKDDGLSSSTTTVYKFDRGTLALVSTIIGSAPHNYASLSVVSDTEFYTNSGGHIYHWRDGQYVSDIGSVGYQVNTQYSPSWFRVLNTSPAYVVSIPTTTAVYKVHVGYETVASSVGKLRAIVSAECSLVGIEPSDIDLDGLTNSDVRGYRVASLGSPRAVLEPLQAAFPFDVVQSGYKVRFVSRGGASVASVPEADLGASPAGESMPVLFPMSREMSSQIPSQVLVKHLDPSREYGTGEQFAERQGEVSENQRTVELAISMTSVEAAQVADVLLTKDWAERRDFGPFYLPPTWRRLEPADVVTVSHRGQDHELRLTRVEYLPDGRLSCSGKLTRASSYVSTSTGGAPTVLGQSLVPLYGSTVLRLLDIPVIDSTSEQNTPGVVVGVHGHTASWPGASVFKSEDGGSSWVNIAGFDSSLTTAGTTANALSSGRTDIKDASSVLAVVLNSGTLSSTNEYGLLNGVNLFAIGAPGRWEVVGVQDWVESGVTPGLWYGSNLLRGGYGTERSVGLHAIGDVVVKIDPAVLQFRPLNVSSIGISRLYRAVTLRRSFDTGVDQEYTYTAENLKPLSPVYLNGSRHPSTRDWSLSWIRRTRMDGGWRDAVDAGLGESSESYDVEVYTDGTYATVKRTFPALTSAASTYTSTEQVADFGSNQATLYLKVYQNSSTVGRGYALTTSITR